jgi:aspartyl-tRNA(Asn)/glutamyl-tRNA(Gln) amidotransferase subunit A
MDKLGPMCRTAVDCGLVLNAIAGEDPLDPTSRREPMYWWPPNDEKRARSLAGKRLGVLRSDSGDDGDPEVRAAFDEAVKVLAKLGAKVEEADLPAFPYGAVATTVYTAEAASVFRPLIDSERLHELIDETQRAGLQAALDLRATDYLDAFRLRTQIAAAMAELFSGYDALVAPSVMFLPPPTGRDFDTLSDQGGAKPESAKKDVPAQQRPEPSKAQIIAASNIAGLPAISVPCGFTREKSLPIGIQFVCDALREDVCIECAHAYQLATDWHTRRPKIE